MSTYIAATNDNFPGQGFVLPADWSEKVAKVEGADHSWTAWEVADLENTDRLHGFDSTFGIEIIRFIWDEDETREAFDNALKGIGFELVEFTSDNEAVVRSIEN